MASISDESKKVKKTSNVKSDVNSMKKTENLLKRYLIWILPCILYFLSMRLDMSLLGLGGSTAATKQYIGSPSFDSFFTSYSEKHQDPMCRSLHFFGTSLVIVQLMMNLKLLHSLGPSLVVGFAVRNFTMFLPHGYIEMIAMGLYFIGTAGKACRSAFPPIVLILTMYSFPFIGHLYEPNALEPFIHPTLSVLTDFRLWYEVVRNFGPYF